MNMSKSKYCRGIQCEKILWLEKNRPDLIGKKDESRMKTGQNVGEIAKGIFGDYNDIAYDKDMAKRVEMTKDALDDGSEIITEASFLFDDNFCSVDILKNLSDGVEIYEVKSSTEIKDVYLDDISYQYFVLEKCNLNVKKAAIVYINNEYIRGDELDLNQLFRIEDITDIARQKQDEIKSNIDAIRDFMQNHGPLSEPSSEIDMHCFNPYECEFWDYCTRDLPKPNVFDIHGMWKSKKIEKYHEGKVSFEDLKNEKLNPKYLQQIDFEINGREPKINMQAICDVLDSLKYPLYFIDYETCQHAIPEFPKTKPYQQIPFQYSLHIIRNEGGPLEHREFLADENDENMIRTFAESMIGDMDWDGSVIVYNKAFESSRNREIGEMYPEYKSEMERFNSNIVDLMVPFKSRDYYTKEMKGSYSMKYVLPALYPDDPDLDYHALPVVHNGGEASAAFLTLKDKTADEREEIRHGLLEYCKLDTLAMVKIWEKFRQVAGRK